MKIKSIEDYSEIIQRIKTLDKLMYNKILKCDFKAAAGFANEMEIAAKLLKQTLLNLSEEK